MLKKLISVIALVSLSCSTDSVEDNKDCNCDRAVRVIVTTVPSPNGFIYTSQITTINDCSGIQLNKQRQTTDERFIAKVGQCY